MRHLLICLVATLLLVLVQAQDFQFSRWNSPRANLAADDVYRRQAPPPGYHPEFGTCGSGTTCENACGSNWITCQASTNLSLFCYNKVDLNQTCCANWSGRACDNGYYCAWQEFGGKVWCCENVRTKSGRMRRSAGRIAHGDRDCYINDNWYRHLNDNWYRHLNDNWYCHINGDWSWLVHHDQPRPSKLAIRADKVFHKRATRTERVVRHFNEHLRRRRQLRDFNHQQQLAMPPGDCHFVGNDNSCVLVQLCSHHRDRHRAGLGLFRFNLVIARWPAARELLDLDNGNHHGAAVAFNNSTSTISFATAGAAGLEVSRLMVVVVLAPLFWLLV
ncbi:hypothetical protein VTI74DRAFT_8125 [Chaetomium olivicolor]